MVLVNQVGRIQWIVVEIVRSSGIGEAGFHQFPFYELRVTIYEYPVKSCAVRTIIRRVQIRVKKNFVGTGETNLHGFLGWMRITIDPVGRGTGGTASDTRAGDRTVE